MRRPLMLAAALMLMPSAAFAHHGWSSYDETRPITLTGPLGGVTWGNPHGTARMNWQGKRWAVVLAPVSRMEARGLTREMLAPNKRVTIVGYARRDGTPEVRLERVIVDGKTVEFR